MTVSKLNDSKKKEIGDAHKAKKMNQKQLAAAYGVSERTINRVLNELGMATAVPRIKGEAYQVMQLLKQHNLNKEGLVKLLEMAPTGVNKAKVAKFMMDLPEAEYAPLLSMITTARVAKNANTSVQTALLNVENKVNKHAKDAG